MAVSKFDVIVGALGRADSKLPQFLAEQSDKRVSTQVELLTAGDARANGLLAVASTFSAAGLAIAADKFGDADAQPLFAAAVGFSCMATLAASLAVWALWPTKINVPGWDPESFINDANAGRSIDDIEHEVVALLQIRIDQNRLALAILGWRARLAVCALAACPIVGAGFGLIAADQKTFGGTLIFAVISACILLVSAREYAIRKEREKLS